MTKYRIFFNLFAGIIILIMTGALVSSCGKGPQSKVNNPNAGQFAIDFSQCPQNTDSPNFDEVCYVAAGQGIKSLANTALTVEAWINDQSSTTLNGGVYSRAYDDAGILLYVNGGKPQFAMKKSGLNAFVVDSGVTLTHGQWTHIAGVLTNQNHLSGPDAHAACGGGTGAGWASSITVDSNDNVHISYVDGGNVLRYANGSSGSWTVERVDTSTAAGQTSTSIDTDSSNKAHISYYDSTNQALMYATNSSGSWASQSGLDSDGDTVNGEWSSIFVDSSSGDAYIAYYNGSKANLKLTDNSGGSFTSAGVDFAGTQGKYNSIDGDSLGRVHISQYDETNGDLRLAIGTRSPYTFNNGSTGDRFAVDTSGDVGKYSSIVVQSNDVTYIAYYDATNTSLKLATVTYVGGGSGNCGTSSNWNCSTQTIDNGGTSDVGQYTSIALDSINKVHISYYDATNGNLKYATNAGVTPGSGNCSGNTNYNCEIVYSTGDVGKYSSLAIDSSDNVHISFLDDTNDTLKYATGTAGSFTTETVDDGDPRSDSTHLDIYVNGVWKACASSNGLYSEALTTRLVSGSPVDINEALGTSQVTSTSGWATIRNPDPISPGKNLRAIVDEVRLWTVARTSTEINACMNHELSLGGGTCGIDPSKLKGYWKFNEGQGIETADHSGGGSSGSLQYCDNQDNGNGSGGGPDGDLNDPEDVDCAGSTADNGTTDWNNASWTAGRF
jgi:hypothetical protein